MLPRAAGLPPPSAAAVRLHAELHAAADPRSGGVWSRFARGLGYPFTGWRFVSAHPELYRFCIIPIFINLVIMTTVVVLLYHYYGDIVAWIWQRPEGFWLRLVWYLLYVFLLLAVVVVGYLLFFILQALLAAPFNDLLSEHVELRLAGHAPPPFSVGRFLRNAVVTLAHESLKLLLLVLILGILWVTCFFLLPVIGAVVFSIVGGAVSAFFFGYDYHDYSLARRRFPFGAKWRLLTSNTAMTLGFGTSVAAMLLVPVLGLFFTPFAAVGGTILVLDYERYGRLTSGPT